MLSTIVGNPRVLQEDTTILGYHIPAGVSISMYTHYSHHATSLVPMQAHAFSAFQFHTLTLLLFSVQH